MMPACLSVQPKRYGARRHALLALALGGVLAAGSACGDDGRGDQPDAGPADARILPDVSPLPPDPDFDDNYTGYGPAVTVTTLVQTLHPRYGKDDGVVDRYGRARVPEDELGKRYPQPGEPFLERDDFGVGDASNIAPQSLLYFLHLSDVQLIDTQSPSYVPANEYTTLGSSLAAFHQQGPLTHHLFDAALQTALQFANYRPFDFVIHTGDSVEDSQENELEWFVTIMDGGEVHPDSGDVDDPIPGPDNDAWDPFLATGLPAGTPWYAVIGNHDINVNGNFPRGLIEEANQEPYVSQLPPLLETLHATLPGVGTADHAPNVFDAADLPAFTVDASDFHLSDLWDEDDILALGPGPVPADPDRIAMNECDYAEAMFGSATDPEGHGFTQANRDRCLGNYTATPVAGLPVRLIVLDTGPHVGGAEGVITPPLNADGTVDETKAGDPTYDQIAWLEDELDRAEQDHVAVIVASHHPSSSLTKSSMFAGIFEVLFQDEVELNELWRKYFIEPEETLSGKELRELLASYPNVFMHLVGHSHENRVNAVCPDGTLIEGPDALQGDRCPDPPDGRTAANGYWEVMAASTRDYPNEFRITEIVDHGDGTGTIYSTVVDPQGGEGSLSYLGRFLALAGQQLEGTPYSEGLGCAADRNVALRVAWPPDVAQALANASAPTEIESLTTLETPAEGLPRLPIWP